MRLGRMTQIDSGVTHRIKGDTRTSKATFCGRTAWAAFDGDPEEVVRCKRCFPGDVVPHVVICGDDFEHGIASYQYSDGSVEFAGPDGGFIAPKE